MISPFPKNVYTKHHAFLLKKRLTVKFLVPFDNTFLTEDVEKVI